MTTQGVDKEYILHPKEQRATTCSVLFYQVCVSIKFSLSSLHSITPKLIPNHSDVVKKRMCCLERRYAQTSMSVRLKEDYLTLTSVSREYFCRMYTP